MAAVHGVHPAAALAVGKLAQRVSAQFVGRIDGRHIVVRRADAADARVRRRLCPQVIDRGALTQGIARRGDPGHIVGQILLLRAEIHVLRCLLRADQAHGHGDGLVSVVSAAAAAVAGPGAGTAAAAADGLVGLERHVAHVIERVFARLVAVICHQAISRLLAAHLVDRVLLAETAGRAVIVSQQIVKDAAVCLHEIAVAVRVAIQRGQRDQDPDVCLRAAEAAVRILRSGQEAQRVVHHGFQLGVAHAAAQGGQLRFAAVIRSQGVDSRRRRVLVRHGAVDAPRTAGKLICFEGRDQPCAEGFSVRVIQITVAVHRQ